MTETVTYINESLKDFYQACEIRSLTRLIIEYVTGLQHHQLLMYKDNELSAKEKKEVQRIIERLQQLEPIQYIIGSTTFYNLPFRVTPSVLIPRPETEELVERIITDTGKGNGRILDIGTGSGCIAVALSKYMPLYDVTGVDISNDALSVARENANINHADVRLIQTDILLVEQAAEDIPGLFDIIVSNPPYVKESEQAVMGKNVLLYEPATALFVTDADPLLFYRAIALFGKHKLNYGGMLYFEINAQCGIDMISLLENMEYKNVELIRDLSGKDRIVKAKK